MSDIAMTIIAYDYALYVIQCHPWLTENNNNYDPVTHFRDGLYPHPFYVLDKRSTVRDRLYTLKSLRCSEGRSWKRKTLDEIEQYIFDFSKTKTKQNRYKYTKYI